MAPSVSKLATVPFNCYELGHTWTPHCSQAAKDLGWSTFKEGFKIYTSCYIVCRLLLTYLHACMGLKIKLCRGLL